jgi:nitroimidazol reductase NimA-like FMN-containing flavoprotein (pyridoxamine 5'-phosphate oxidase superfamily)
LRKLDLSLSPSELDEFLTRQRTIRLATAGPEGLPQVIPLWYVWLEGAVFLNSTLGNVTVRNVQRNPLVAGVIDDGVDYEELCGVVVHGRLEPADGDPRLSRVRELWSRKYMGGDPVPYDRWRNRVWLRLMPSHTASWDFRKIPQAKARARDRARSPGV